MARYRITIEFETTVVTVMAKNKSQAKAKAYDKIKARPALRFAKKATTDAQEL